MQNQDKLSGVYAAAITPVDAEFKPDLDAIQNFMAFLADRACHGALILGTTGEGPSFSSSERYKIMQAAAEIKKIRPDFRLFAGTGTPSLRETIGLNQAAFELGYDAAVVLPPYYFRSANEAGLLAWFKEVIAQSVPEGKILLGYHIPQVSGVPFTVELLEKLYASFPNRFGGLKDSEGKLVVTRGFTEAFPDKLILVGSDRLLTDGLKAGASGSITALANLISPWLREIFDGFRSKDRSELQAKTNLARNVLDQFAPFPASIKYLIHAFAEFPLWSVVPPLEPLDQQQQVSLNSQFDEIYNDA